MPSQIAFDAIRVVFYHQDWNFRDLTEQNPTLSAIVDIKSKNRAAVMRFGAAHSCQFSVSGERRKS
jgi:hypothetical protein